MCVWGWWTSRLTHTHTQNEPACDITREDKHSWKVETERGRALIVYCWIYPCLEIHPLPTPQLAAHPFFPFCKPVWAGLPKRVLTNVVSTAERLSRFDCNSAKIFFSLPFSFSILSLTARYDILKFTCKYEQIHQNTKDDFAVQFKHSFPVRTHGDVWHYPWPRTVSLGVMPSFTVLLCGAESTVEVNLWTM